MRSARRGVLLLAVMLLTGGTLVARSFSRTFDPSRADVLWREPTNLAARDLFYGPGGRAHAPAGTTFRFLSEDLNGSNPKFEVVDDAGTKWKLKMGWEAQPETAASRVVWAVGYFADEDYYLPYLCVQGVPAHLHRGRHFVDAAGCINGGRLKRHNHEKADAETDVWSWRQNPFTGTRALNGLRVLMAVINNWDVKDINNRVRLIDDGDGDKVRAFLVSDLGASFGPTHLTVGHAEARGDLDRYRESRFVVSTTECCVDFAVPDRAAPIVLANPKEYYMRLGLRWIGQAIPREDARWMGALLGGLTADQLHDAFRAAGYSKEDSDALTETMALRIAELRKL
jgi:hypothetical protein